MEYPKKLVEDYRGGLISRREFEQKFSAIQKKNGLDFSFKGYGDKNGIFYIYRGQKAVLKNGILEWSYGKIKTAKNLFEFRRKIDAQILGEKR